MLHLIFVHAGSDTTINMKATLRRFGLVKCCEVEDVASNTASPVLPLVRR